MSSICMDSYLRPFRGKGDDFNTFWDKFEVLAGIQGWSTDEDKMKRFPLFVEGDAFLVLMKMAAADRKDPAKVKEKMTSAFAVTASMAYSLFTSRKLRTDESVDTYVADLQRLLETAGHRVADAEKDRVLLEQFISGLSLEYARQVRMALAGKTPTLSQCMGIVRALQATESGAAATREPSVTAAVGAASGGGSSGSGNNVLCYHCKQVGHIRRNCPQKRAAAQTSGPSEGKPGKSLTCFFCDGVGHTKKECPERKSWMASRKSAVAAAADDTSTDCCLGLASQVNRSDLPRIWVDVRAADNEWRRCKAVIDTGSTRTLISKPFAMNDLKAVVTQRHEVSDLVAIDGSALCVFGTVPISLHRVDEKVRLPCLDSTAVVVSNLDVVNASILIGADFISSAGGLHLGYNADNVLSGVTFGNRVAESSCIGAVSDPLKHPVPYVSVTSQPDGDVAKMARFNGRLLNRNGCYPGTG